MDIRKLLPVRFVLMAAALLVIAYPSYAQTNRFWTMTGGEPMGHDVDPDYGNRREFFRVSPAVWVERFADGYLLGFSTVGRAQLPRSAVFGTGGQPGSVAGTIIRAGNGLGYFVPDQLATGMFLTYRLNDSANFMPSGVIFPLEPDSDSSRMYVHIAANMSQVKKLLLDAIPPLIDERDDPNKNDERYRFDALPDNAHRRVDLVSGRIYVQQVYQGDYETKCTFCLGCHLKPLYVQADIDLVPALVRDASGKWAIAPTDSHVKLTLLPGSDTKCTFVGFDVTRMINEALGRENLKQRAVDAISKASVQVPVDDLWSRLGGPFVRIVDGQTFCIYPQMDAFWVSGLQGNFDAASFEISARGAPKVVALDSCPAAQARQFQLFDGNQPGGQSQIIFDVVIPYTSLRQTLLQTPSVRDAGFNDLSIEPHQAYLTIRFNQAGGQSVLVNAIPVVGIPAEPGDVSLALVFADVPGPAGGSLASALNGSTVMSLNEQINSVKKALLGAIKSGNLSVTITNNSFSSMVNTAENDGLHSYLTFLLSAAGNYIE